jgi:Transposase DDE domain/Domain of unknown function (DUF4372)
MDKNSTKTVFKKYLEPIEQRIFSKMASHLDIDKYVKKLNTLCFTKLFIYAQLHQIQSLEDISLEVKNNKSLQKELGLNSISASQLSRKLRSIPPCIFEAILNHLIQRVRQTFGVKDAHRILEKIHLIDSSTITLCLRQYPWAPKNRYTSGIKMHTRVVYHDGVTYPDKLIITPARPGDLSQLDSLIVNEKGAMHVFDRGYFDFKRFDNYCAEGILFTTRIKENTIIRVVEEVPVAQDSSIKREAIVFLGKMKHPLRLIETADSKGNPIEIIINDAKMPAEEVSSLYRDRWQIETFFKWMKQHTVLKTSYGKSENAVHNQVYLAMIAFCLTLLMKNKIQYKGVLLTLKKHIALYCLKSFQNLVKELFRPPTRKSEGRKRMDYEEIFLETLRQVEEGKFKAL